MNQDYSEMKKVKVRYGKESHKNKDMNIPLELQSCNFFLDMALGKLLDTLQI